MREALPRFLFALLIATAFAATGCSDPGPSEEGGDTGEDTTPSDADAGPDTSNNPEYEVGNFCLESGECGPEWCDKQKGGCVECFMTSHCPDDLVCFNGECVDLVSCEDTCEAGVCVDNVCVECETDEDCDGTFVCVEQVCRPPAALCDADEDCHPIGATCDETSGICQDCTDDSQCQTGGEYCNEGVCTPLTCIPGEQSCLGDLIQICRTDGQGYYLIACSEGESCLKGSCTELDCVPNTTECLQHQIKECTEDGTLIIKGCGPSQECVNGECQEMRQRVLVIFDTSGSMNSYAEKQEYPKYCASSSDENCLQPWPTCEGDSDPFTVAGLSKKVFSQFFKSEDTQHVHFALQRFPQRTSDSPPVCEGGYYVGDTIMTNDPGNHTTPLGSFTWFDAFLSEIILVPFPPPDSTSNLLSLIHWLDFKETLFETDESCLAPEDCEDGVCIGPTWASKKCHVFTNPELRMHGWTPLGRSLYYAGEYLRRNVVVDGKPCETDTDCASVGYYCNEVNKCYDPMRDCRLTVVVLFTDGGETEFQYTNQFFHPAVQAKRLRYGLSCSSDDDCSKLPFCTPVDSGLDCVTDDDCLLTDYECNEVLGACLHKTDLNCNSNYCQKTSEAAPTGYCSNDVIEAVGAPTISLQDTQFGQDHLTDYNGNPISVIVNVVDASTTADDIEESSITLTNNFQIALHGGGLHVVVSVDDEADFLAKLKATIDPKSLFEQCSF
jgi:hypothetical protein